MPKINPAEKFKSGYKQLLAIFNGIDQIIYTADPDTHEILFVNAHFKKILGEDPTGHRCYEKFQGFHHPCDFCTSARLLKYPYKTINWEHYNPLLKRYFLLTDRLIPWTHGRKARFELAIDITNLKKIQEDLQLAKEKYALAQQIAQIGTWDWDILTSNLEWSDNIESMFGFKSGEFQKTYEAFLACIHPADRKHVIDSVNAALAKNLPYNIEHRVLRPDGSLRWISEIGTVLRDKKGSPLRMIGVCQDVTEDKKSQELLKEDKEKAEEEVQQKEAELSKAKRLSDIGTLAATVAHELRNPLGVIQAAVFNLKRKNKNSRLDPHLQNIEKKIAESSQIINNLLSYSRIKIPRYKDIKIKKFLQDCVDSIQHKFYDQPIKIETRLDRIEKLKIRIDPFQIREVINNILNNAIQALEDKRGKIFFTARKAKSGWFEMIIKDNGDGIEKADLPRIFDPFFTRRSKGTGLGLTVSNELINLHGGEIRITSQKNQGTKVYLKLPLKRDSHPGQGEKSQ